MQKHNVCNTDRECRFKNLLRKKEYGKIFEYSDKIRDQELPNLGIRFEDKGN